MGVPLATKDANAPVQAQDAANAANKGKLTGAQSLEYHRQALQSKMEEEKYGANATNASNTNTNTSNASNTTDAGVDAADLSVKHPQNNRFANIVAAGGHRQHKYISPSDNIVSPCTAKLNAFKGRAAGRAKPKSLFAQSSAKKFNGDNIFGSAKTTQPKDDPKPGN